MADCRAKVARDRVYRNGQTWIRTYCENCGANCGYVVESTDYAWSHCDPCAEKFRGDTNRVDPYDLWFTRVQHEQVEIFGHEPSLYEIVMQLWDPASQLSLLAKDKPKFGGS